MAQNNPTSNETRTAAMTFEKQRSLSGDSSSSSVEGVRVVKIEEYEQAAQCLAEAFAVDEVARYFLDTDDMQWYGEEYKWKLHVNIIRYITWAHCYKGIVTTVGEGFGAVALWMPPGRNMDDLWTILRSGMWRLYYKLSAEGKKRYFNEFLPLLHDTKHEVMAERDDDSYYLVYLGTRPSARGKGYAGKLIEHMTAVADLEGRATYLESSAETNLPYYKKYGFVQKCDVSLKRAKQEVKMHIMVREPQVMAESSKGKENKVQETVRIRSL